MARVSYSITAADDGQWLVTRNGTPGMSYLTQEAAFEVAIGEAGGDLRTGYDIVIAVAAATEPAGAVEQGGKPIPGDGFSG
jgi:hypothetical protein